MSRVLGSLHGQLSKLAPVTAALESQRGQLVQRTLWRLQVVWDMSQELVQDTGAERQCSRLRQLSLSVPTLALRPCYRLSV